MLVFFEKVRYSTHHPFPDASRIEENEQIKTLFLTKSVDWMHEKEWRFFAPARKEKGSGFDGLIEPSPFSVEKVLCGVGCRHHMLFTDLADGGATLKMREILDDSMIALIKDALYADPFKGKVLGDFSKIISVLDEFTVDDKKDTVETADSKNEICSSIIFEFLQNNGWQVGLKKSGKDFQVEIDESLRPLRRHQAGG